MDLIKYSFKELFAQELSQTDFAEYTKEVTIYCSPALMPSIGMTINGVDFNFINGDNNGANVKVMAKFNGTVAYNITNYFGKYLNHIIQPMDMRAAEEDVVKLVVAMQKSFQNATSKMQDLILLNPAHLRQNTRFLSIANSVHHNYQLMRDSNYDSKGLAVLIPHLQAQPMYEYLYSLVMDAKIVVPSDVNAIAFARETNLFAAFENDHNYTVVAGEQYSGVIAVNDTVLNYIRYYMPALYVRECELTNILYATADLVENDGQIYELLRSNTVNNNFARTLDQESILPTLLNMAIETDEYCEVCDTALTAIRDNSLFNDLDNYVDMWDLINVDSDHSYTCMDCADRRRNENAKFENLISYNGGSIIFNDTAYPRYVYDDGINEYDYGPYFDMYGDGLHLGAEIEVDRGGESDTACNIACNIMTYNGKLFTYGMHDGSLNDGFEIGTMPATLDVHKQVAYKDAFQFLVNAGYRAHDTDTCGIHIHFDRDFLGATHRTINTKVAYLTYILEHNWEKVVKFTRRNYHELNRWAPKKDLIQDVYADDDEDAIISKFNGKYNYDKYVAVNTQHSNSIELRIFRGTLDYNSYMSILEFVDNLVHLTKGITNITQAQQVTFADIINYKPTDYLVAYCQERGII